MRFSHRLGAETEGGLVNVLRVALHTVRRGVAVRVALAVREAVPVEKHRARGVVVLGRTLVSTTAHHRKA